MRGESFNNSNESSPFSGENVGEEDISLFRNQVRAFIQNLKCSDAYLNAENSTDFALILIQRAEKIFGKREMKDNVSEFFTDEFEHDSLFLFSDGEIERNARIKEISDSMITLLAYLDFHIGDPIAMELFSDTLGQAREVLKRDMAICSVLLCRLTLEQSLRRLCEKNNIEIEPNEKASSLKDKLKKPEGILEVHEWKEVDTKLTFENKVLHGEIKASTEETGKLIDWTEKFITHFLAGSD